MKKPFEVGERVRVYRGGRKPFAGTVTNAPAFGNEAVGVTEDGFYSAHDESPFHPRQLIRLKPRQKKKQVEGRVFWVSERNVTDAIKEIENEKEVAWASVVFDASFEKEAEGEVCLREILPGEVVINKEKLAAAWGRFRGFDDFCKALNLPEKGA